MNESQHPCAEKSWPDYRAVWRWHFYAGLFCIPFVVVLAVSGSIYLFKDEIESWIDRRCDDLEVTGHPARAADQIRSALAAVPGSRLNAYELPQADDSAVQVIVGPDGGATRVYLHPESLRILKTVAEDDRLTRIVFRLHTALLVGDTGSAVLELAASWAIIMIVTGLYLWWPRGRTGLGGVIYPRTGGSSRIFWRDIHGVTGLWISALALFMLLSGLSATRFWGGYFNTLRRLASAAVTQQGWTNGRAAPPSAGMEMESGGQGGYGSGATGVPKGRSQTPIDLGAVDRIVVTVRALQLAPPVLISPPGRGSSDWTARSLTANRPMRVDLEMDGTTGAVKNRVGFRDRHLIDRLLGTGIAAHGGSLFGWPNRLLGVFTASGLIVLSISAVIMWWRRREPGVLGSPRIAVSPRFSFGLLLLVVMFGLSLPLFGASLIAVKLLEKVVLCRIPRVRDWLGLQNPGSRFVTTGA